MTSVHDSAIDSVSIALDGHDVPDVVMSPEEHRRKVLEAPVVLRVRELDKSFRGLHAVNKVSFDLHKGEVISIIGPNGSGKSTTINLISGFITPDSGIIDIDDDPVAGLPATEVSERGLSRTFQNGRVFGGLTVDENINLGYHKKLQAQRPFKNLQKYPIVRWIPLLAETGVALIHGPKTSREIKEVDVRVGREVDRFRERLGDRRNDLTYTLSYANRRRTEIARAHISEPKLLLLDEPTAGMNQSETAEVLEQLQHLKAQGHTILLVEHKIDLVTALSDRVLAMDGGRIIAQGSPDEVRTNPQVVEAYLGKRKETNQTRSRGQVNVLAMQNAIEHDGVATVNEPESAGGVESSADVDPFAGTETLLSLDKINVFYGQVHALQDVSITIPKGAIVSLLGGNASGKSTTMKTILGINHPKNGTIRYEGADITHESTRRRVASGIASVPEARRVFPQMTVQENLLSGAYTRTDKAGIAEDLDSMYERFPRLKERRGQQAGTMSGGEQQMLAFVRALMSRPKIICMDEPTMGLSPKLVEDVLEQIARLRDELDLSVLMVEQQAELALTIADYGYVLQNGRIRLHGKASDLLGNPQVQEAYLGGAKN
ncbi:ATP-binding cassette domain-containing protein [Bifidobacterium tissieri]|uniref:ATP-binding cassette domain-containing protein n=1 Tax=Bifidobacterium tissieri TaxID=1630162 RepID=A0A5M9ZWZ6_9BIFI|nr:ATP-binding cassette domain-containing protein [Bifidobacterium tissieri]KAA8832167.1 ATP-binding cassette domain-containing protein [Bifidobacterium tissieri]KAA8832219.1 ATP-binding cassette domain-containing protein [Bifidobacterium tissieri]